MSIFNLFKKNDWYPVYSRKAVWSVTYENDGESIDEIAIYEIMFSPSRKRFKLNIGGYKPKEHSAYELMTAVLNQYINNYNEKNIISSDGDIKIAYN